MKRFRLRSVLALGLVAGLAASCRMAGSPVAAQDLPKQELSAADDLLPTLERVVTSVVDPDGPGAAGPVVKDGKVVMKKGYGVPDLEKKTTLTPHTTSEIP